MSDPNPSPDTGGPVPSDGSDSAKELDLPDAFEGVTAASDAPLPPRIGPYIPFRRLGHGGMGIVYAARQESPPRNVALKVLRHSLPSEETRRRFEFESRVLARLRHPCIAQIYDVGAVESPSGGTIPYFAMELIEGGKPITSYAREANLSLEERLRLMLRVLEGVHHGHQRGIIHRDLKPANILIDSEGNPRIIDFGVARATESDEYLASMHTETGQLLGTPQYMSPEQLGGDARDIDSRTDLFSIGVVLFELVSGRLPYEIESKSLFEICDQVRHAPTRRLSSVHSRFRGDLDTIVETAMAKDRERRYQSATAIAADLRRYLAKEPIAARPPSAMYQIRMFARRHKVIVTAAVAVFLVCVVGMIVSTRFALIAARRAEESRREAYRSRMFAAGLALDSGDLTGARDYLERAPETLRGWEWRYLHGRLTQAIAAFEDLGGEVEAVAVSPDGAILGTGGVGHLSLRRAESGESLGELQAPGRIHSLFFSPDGARVFAEGARYGLPEDRTLFWLAGWEVASGREVSRLELDEPRIPQEDGFALMPDGKRAIVALGLELRVIDLASGAVLWGRPIAGAIDHRTPLAVSPDGRRVAVLATDHSITILDGSDLRATASLPGRGGHALVLAFSPDGSRLAGGFEDAVVRIWALGGDEAGRPPLDLQGHAARVNRVAYLPGGGRIATASMDGTARIWSTVSGECLGVFRGHRGEVTDLACWPQGDRVATASRDGSVRIWDLDLLEKPTVLRGHRSYVNPVVMTPDGSMIVSGGWDNIVGDPGTLRFWDADTGAAVGCCNLGETVMRLAISPNGRALAAGTGERLVLLDARTGAILRTLPEATPYARCVFDPQGRLVFGANDGTLRTFDLSLGREVEPVRLPDSGGEPLGFSPSGRWLAVAVFPETVLLLDGRTFEVRTRIESGPMISFSPDERTLLSTSDGSVCVCRVESGELIARIDVPSPWGATYSPDGSRIFVLTGTGKIHVVDARTFEEVAQLTGHASYVFAVAFGPKGERVVSGSGDGTVRIWETATLADRLRAGRERERIVARVAPRVQELFERGLAPAAVVETLEQAPWFSTARERQVALQVALGESLRRATPVELR